jgi:hypothetical protein
MSSVLDPLAQITTDFTPQPREYGIHNANPEQVERMFAGNIFIFPPRDEVGPNPAYDAAGHPIPGTLAIRDEWGIGSESLDPSYGEDHMTLDAAAAVRHVLGLVIQRVPGQRASVSRFSSRAALSGLSLLPEQRQRTPDRLAVVFAEGLKRFETADLDNARATVSAYLGRTEAHTKAGIPLPPPGHEYEVAVLKLNKANEEMKKRLGSAAAIVEQMVDEEELQFEAYAKAKAIALAQETAKEIALNEHQKMQLVENLLHDPKVRLGLKKNWRIREKGYMEPDESKLEALAQSGQNVVEEP